MKKFTIFVGSISILTVLATLINVAIKINKLEHCRNTYEYTLDNIKGTNNQCFEKNGKSICRIDNHNPRVDKIEKIEVCR